MIGPNAKTELLAEHNSAQGPKVLQIRGSLIASSLQTLRELNLFDRYLQQLPPARHEEVLFVLASSWVPVELALVHYGACDAMDLGEDETDAIGRHVSNRIMSTFVGTLVRTSRTVAAPGQVPLKQYPRLWDRLMIGGGCRVYATGMKDARIESRGVPMFRYRYFRTAYMGLIRGAGMMFRSAVYTRQRSASEDTLTIDISWV
jgi:hypothetical protein